MQKSMQQQTMERANSKRPVYLVNGYRTPILKARGVPGPFSASDLAVMAGRRLLTQQRFAPEAIDQVILGCMIPSVDESNIARIVALRLGLGHQMPAWTVQRNCASGMQAIDAAIKDIELGRSDLVLAGGTEAMSHSPLLYNRRMVNWFANLQRAKNLGARVSQFFQLKPGALLSPVIALLHGLTDPLSGMSMGQTAEELAYRFNISREDMDEFALYSHQRAQAAFEQGHLHEVMPLYANDGKVFDRDDGVRADTSLASLAKLKPFFDRRFGAVTAGNSSQVSDGAALLLLASEEALTKHQLTPIAKLVDVEWAALDPDVMGLGPVMAAAPIFQRQKLSMPDIDFWEINEAFAAQTIACVKAFDDTNFCREHFGLSASLGQIDMSRLNMDGGAVAIGHPVGASGARIVLHLANVLRRERAKRGMAAICIGGGQGGAMLLESV
jgi:acetyl-CoA C-acetyltransferase